MQTDHDRYLHNKKQPQHRLTTASIAWTQGFEAGWKAAADRWMTTPQLNDCPGEDDTTQWPYSEDAA